MVRELVCMQHRPSRPSYCNMRFAATQPQPTPTPPHPTPTPVAINRLPFGPLRQKDTPPRLDSPNASNQPPSGLPFSDADGLALGADIEAGNRSVSGEDVERRRRRAGGRLVEGRAGGVAGAAGSNTSPRATQKLYDRRIS